MVWDPTLYTVVGLAGTALFLFIAAAGWQYRSEPAAKAFLGLLVALGGWIGLYAVGLGFTSLAEQLAWQRTALAIGGLVPTLWFLFAVQYTNRTAWLTPPVKAFMIIDPLLFGLLTLTNPSHGLIWRETTLVSYGLLTTIQVTFGPAYVAHLLYTYVITSLGFGFLALAVVRSALYRTQATLLVVGAIPPLVANAAYVLGADWGVVPALDYTPFGFFLTGPFFGLALFRFDLLERVPVARKRIVDDAEDGFVVLDEAARIITANPAAERILDGAVEGECIHACLPEYVLAGSFDPDAIEGQTMTTVIDRTERAYDLACSSLSDHHGRVVGYVLRFRDVSDRHVYEQRLKVANRVLRHNLRNRMNVISGWAEELQDHDDPAVVDASERIATAARELTDVGEQVRLLVETADVAGGATTVVVETHLTPLLERVRADYPAATVESDLDPDVTVTVPSAKLLTVAVQNAVENAIEHNDSDHPWVRITAQPAEGGTGDAPYTEICVADDGPGIPEAEREVIRSGTETALEHGSGLGLWLVQWIATAAGGDVEFADRNPCGTVVTLTLPTDPPTNAY
ncbi:histidine kinase N-terminal 7TM domain-containing protein [Haloplanus sp. C73]|uniref:histidine kinase N-terminal 7TM domain-containing protein n=1 Tax=Haloplanus sp. C73 TaxID=3421641 RepID=UPI003EB7A367